jgi:predicted outer membrane repeat protein
LFSNLESGGGAIIYGEKITYEGWKNFEYLENSATLYGGGMAIFNFPADNLSNNTFMKNFTFINNSATEFGGGFFLRC